MDHQIRVCRSDLESMLLDESVQPRDLPLPLLEDITGGFSCDQEIGRGGFAVVYKGTLKNGAVAVKKLINTHIHENKFQQEMYNKDCYALNIYQGLLMFTLQVLESWRNMVGISQRNKELEQIRVCAEIGLECIDSNPRRRPTTEHILDRLYQMESANLSTETSENITSVMTQPECYISEGCHPSASTAKKPNDEPSVKQKRDSKCQQESVNNNQCSGYYTWQEIKTEKGDYYFNASYHDDQTSKNLDYFVVVDFKATCEKGKKINPQEIIEFSSVLVDGSTGQLESTFHTYVRPLQHPKLTDYCRDLNGIRQKDVDAGVELAVAFRMHGAWLQKMGTKKSSRFCFVVVTWGNWDCRGMLEPECRLKGIGRPPYFDRWINLRIPFVAAFGGKLTADLANAVRMAGMEWEGRPRGASDDARNTARLLGELMRQGTQLGITSSVAPMPAPQLL
ncbi:unnamed protein product [Miscanthus lutarioriparius]|uniref:Exonuclease domain-containing protein n=1 Tax=Miscanthus lutarioriparius TaxID=422564 RepID=A0A811RA95_9POAL|nr:unnamed protein product [Miscanthus lutarioriparius]